MNLRSSFNLDHYTGQYNDHLTPPSEQEGEMEGKAVIDTTATVHTDKKSDDAFRESFNYHIAAKDNEYKKHSEKVTSCETLDDSKSYAGYNFDSDTPVVSKEEEQSSLSNFDLVNLYAGIGDNRLENEETPKDKGIVVNQNKTTFTEVEKELNTTTQNKKEVASATDDLMDRIVSGTLTGSLAKKTADRVESPSKVNKSPSPTTIVATLTEEARPSKRSIDFIWSVIQQRSQKAESTPSGIVETARPFADAVADPLKAIYSAMNHSPKANYAASFSIDKDNEATKQMTDSLSLVVELATQNSTVLADEIKKELNNKKIVKDVYTYVLYNNALPFFKREQEAMSLSAAAAAVKAYHEAYQRLYPSVHKKVLETTPRTVQELKDLSPEKQEAQAQAEVDSLAKAAAAEAAVEEMARYWGNALASLSRPSTKRATATVEVERK